MRACAQEADEPAVSEEPPFEGAQTFVWGTNVNVADATARFRNFLVNFELPVADAADALPRPYYVQKLHEIKQRQARATPPRGALPALIPRRGHAGLLAESGLRPPVRV